MSQSFGAPRVETVSDTMARLNEHSPFVVVWNPRVFGRTLARRKVILDSMRSAKTFTEYSKWANLLQRELDRCR